jgi:hypothetical protein
MLAARIGRHGKNPLAARWCISSLSDRVVAAEGRQMAHRLSVAAAVVLAV